jgi:hypothetical protein
MRVSSDGGTREPLTTLSDGQVTHRWPQILSGGKAVLFTGHTNGTGFDDARLEVQTLSTGERKVVQPGGYHGRYLASGHLVFIHGGTLFAAPFDIDQLEVTRPPVPVLEGVTSNELTGAAQFAVSPSGTLVYLPGQSTSGGLPIHWLDHEGKTTPLRAARAAWFNLLFSTDGRRLAYQMAEGQNDVWVYEWARDGRTNVTHDPANDIKPVWAVDDSRLVFAYVFDLPFCAGARVGITLVDFGAIRCSERASVLFCLQLAMILAVAASAFSASSCRSAATSPLRMACASASASG